MPELRQNIIQLFFKHLTSPDDSLIATAQQGLGRVISSHKMPKGLLQLSLRPILVNLAYHNKLKLPLLKGLARLLQLLASWFNVTLGEAQLDNMTHTDFPHVPDDHSGGSVHDVFVPCSTAQKDRPRGYHFSCCS